MNKIKLASLLVVGLLSANAVNQSVVGSDNAGKVFKEFGYGSLSLDFEGNLTLEDQNNTVLEYQSSTPHASPANGLVSSLTPAKSFGVVFLVGDLAKLSGDKPATIFGQNGTTITALLYRQPQTNGNDPLPALIPGQDGESKVYNFAYNGKLSGNLEIGASKVSLDGISIKTGKLNGFAFDIDATGVPQKFRSFSKDFTNGLHEQRIPEFTKVYTDLNTALAAENARLTLLGALQNTTAGHQFMQVQRAGDAAAVITETKGFQANPGGPAQPVNLTDVTMDSKQLEVIDELLGTNYATKGTVAAGLAALKQDLADGGTTIARALLPIATPMFGAYDNMILSSNELDTERDWFSQSQDVATNPVRNNLATGANGADKSLSLSTNATVDLNNIFADRTNLLSTKYLSDLFTMTAAETATATVTDTVKVKLNPAGNNGYDITNFFGAEFGKGVLPNPLEAEGFTSIWRRAANYTNAPAGSYNEEAGQYAKLFGANNNVWFTPNVGAAVSSTNPIEDNSIEKFDLSVKDITDRIAKLNGRNKVLSVTGKTSGASNLTTCVDTTKLAFNVLTATASDYIKQLVTDTTPISVSYERGLAGLDKVTTEAAKTLLSKDVEDLIAKQNYAAIGIDGKLDNGVITVDSPNLKEYAFQAGTVVAVSTGDKSAQLYAPTGDVSIVLYIETGKDASGNTTYTANVNKNASLVALDMYASDFQQKLKNIISPGSQPTDDIDRQIALAQQLGDLGADIVAKLQAQKEAILNNAGRYDQLYAALQAWHTNADDATLLSVAQQILGGQGTTPPAAGQFDSLFTTQPSAADNAVLANGDDAALHAIFAKGNAKASSFPAFKAAVLQLRGTTGSGTTTPPTTGGDTTTPPATGGDTTTPPATGGTTPPATGGDTTTPPTTGTGGTTPPATGTGTGASAAAKAVLASNNITLGDGYKSVMFKNRTLTVTDKAGKVATYNLPAAMKVADLDALKALAASTVVVNA